MATIKPSSDLVNAVLKRAPLSRRPFAVLLYLAMHADQHDLCIASSPQIALHMRLSKRGVDASLKQLEAAGYVSRPRWGHIKNPHVRHLYVNREVLLSLPVRFGKNQEREKIRRRQKSAVQVVANEKVAKLRDFISNR